MSDKYEVISGLKSCAQEDFNCGSCPYVSHKSCRNMLMKDALHLILGETHKVLTLEEIVNDEHQLITEFKNGIEAQYFSLEDRCRWLGQGRKYGVTWRCWSGKPTEEERKNTEWIM